MSLVAYDNSSDESDDEIKTRKKPKESVKIRIPSLREFEDEDDKPVVKKPKLQSGSGLFSLLPPPKNTPVSTKPGFVPYVLSSKKEKSSAASESSNKSFTPAKLKTVSECISPKGLAQTAILEEFSGKSDLESDEENVPSKESDSNVAVRNDFFWLDDLASKNETDVQDHKLTVTEKADTQNLFSHLPSSSYSSIQQTHLNDADVYAEHHQHLSESDLNKIDQNHESDFPYEQQLQFTGSAVHDPKESLLEDKEFLKLKGRRRDFEDVNIIDVSADDQLSNKNEWMKSLTEETTYRPKSKYNMPTQQQKRKHQITYLAFQAKEREMDLKNQWALNSRTRRETQAKYGF